MHKPYILRTFSVEHFGSNKNNGAAAHFLYIGCNHISECRSIIAMYFGCSATKSITLKWGGTPTMHGKRAKAFAAWLVYITLIWCMMFKCTHMVRKRSVVWCLQIWRVYVYSWYILDNVTLLKFFFHLIIMFDWRRCLSRTTSYGQWCRYTAIKEYK